MMCVQDYTKTCGTHTQEFSATISTVYWRCSSLLSQSQMQSCAQLRNIIRQRSSPSYKISQDDSAGLVIREEMWQQQRAQDRTQDSVTVTKKPGMKLESRQPSSSISRLGNPIALHTPGWGRGGGMEGLHIPAGWHNTSHQRRVGGSELENNPSFFQT